MTSPATAFRSAHSLLTVSLVALALLAVAGTARAEWLQPDATWRDALLEVRVAARDTAGQATPARLDTLGAALLKLGRFDEASQVYGRALAANPADHGAAAALGKIALFEGRLAAAESLLAGSAPEDFAGQNDRLDALVRAGAYDKAADLAGTLQQSGRSAMLREMAEGDVYRVLGGPLEAKVPWTRSYPVPLVRVKLNGQRVLMAIDTGAGDVMLDEAAARRANVHLTTEQRPVFWCGTQVAVKNAMIQKFEIGGMAIERVPAGAMALHRFSLEINPQSEDVVGIIGLNLLRRFSPTLDYQAQRLVLRRPGVALPVVPATARVPFQVWGESELMVYGTFAGGRRMAMVVQTGVPGCGIGAPPEVFDEVGVRPTTLAKLVKGAGSWLQGRPWSAVVVPAIAVGYIVKDKVPGWSGALDPAELWRHGVRRDALLSSEFFRGRSVTIDWDAQQLLFGD